MRLSCEAIDPDTLVAYTGTDVVCTLRHLADDTYWNGTQWLPEAAAYAAMTQSGSQWILDVDDANLVDGDIYIASFTSLTAGMIQLVTLFHFGSTSDAHEMSAAGAFFWNQFTADSGSGGLVGLVGQSIYEDSAPTSTDLPCIVFSLHSGTDLSAGNEERLLTNAEYLVRGVGVGGGYKGSGVDAVAARIDVVLHLSGANAIVRCVRLRPFSRKYTLNGVTYYERGGFYLLRIHGGS